MNPESQLNDLQSFNVYTGPSMNPTLVEPDLMEVEPYGETPPQIGDVVVFVSPENDSQVVHRIVEIMVDGIRTRGDNCSDVDDWVLQPKHIVGKVLSVSRGDTRRQLANGAAGAALAKKLHRRRRLRVAIRWMLHPLYRGLAWTGIGRLLPATRRVQVVTSQSGGTMHARVMLDGREIGWYNHRRGTWEIRFPYLFLVNKPKLPRPEGE